MLNLLSTSIAIIGGADGPTAVFVSGNLPLPAIFVSVVGVIFVAYVYIAKAIRRKALPKEAIAVIETPTAERAGVPMPERMNQGELELVGTDEKTAAVIMAIVSDKSGIPLNRLSFKSIKLMEDK
ncbi:MAG: sodium ion-translocating decarboxylase subunit beta [Ruminococcaceae bacterium]|nr:sodium ion-translocating decarboxylase subunit beta [Oscillospiraceae bacterium]